MTNSPSQSLVASTKEAVASPPTDEEAGLSEQQALSGSLRRQVKSLKFLYIVAVVFILLAVGIVVATVVISFGSSSDSPSSSDGTSNIAGDGQNNSSVEGTIAPGPATGCSRTRCGCSWLDANGKCGTACAAWPDDGWDVCTGGENCYGELSTDLSCCQSGSAPVPAPATAQVCPTPAPVNPSCSSTRCGVDWQDAAGKCGNNCALSPEEGWDACTDGEACFADLTTDLSCCESETTTSPASSCKTKRCGVDWQDAYGKCGSNCASWPEEGWDACTDGEECFADLSTDLACCASGSAPVPTAVPVPGASSSCLSTRCGLDWQDANNKCGTDCASWPDDGWDACTDGESCFSDLRTELSCCG